MRKTPIAFTEMEDMSPVAKLSDVAQARLLMFLSIFAIGGTERQVLNLATSLDPERFDLHMACFNRCGEFLPEMQAKGIPITEFKTNSLYNHRAMGARLKLARYVRQHRIQIIHTYGFYPNVFAIPAARLAGVPVVIASIRDIGENLSAAQKQVQKWFCRLADCILANADGVRSWLISEGYAAEKIHVVRNGIVASPEPSRSARGWLRAEFGLPAHTPLIGVLARLSRLKGIEYLLEAATKVSRRFPAARFMVIGDGSHKSALEKHAAQLGISDRVIFTGFRTDVVRLLPELTISVLPSLSEGLSNSLLEAMAAGVPVIATRVGGAAEAVLDGTTGILVKPADEDALARAMCLLLGNDELAGSFGRAGRRRVQELFSVEKMVRETESLYTRLLQRNIRGRRAARAA